MAESTTGLINLKVKTLPNGNHDVEVPPGIRVEELKRRLVYVTSVPFERQRLIYRGRVLNNDDTLTDHGVGEGHTVHLVERPADAPSPASSQPQTQHGGHGQQGNSARISVNVGSTGGSGIGVYDISRMVHGVLRAVSVDGQMPLQVQMGSRVVSNTDLQSGNPGLLPASSTAQQGSGSVSTPPLGGSQGMPTLETVPHVLHTLNSYVNRLSAGSLATRTLPVPSVRTPPTGNQAQPASFDQEIHALTGSICSILQGADLPHELQAQLESVQEGMRRSAGHNGNVRLSVLPTSSGTGQGPEPPAQPYTHLPLLISALARLTSSADTLFRERASRSLRNACQQLQTATEVDESNQELLMGGIRQIASVLHWYGALFIELARVTACALPALQGNVLPLAANISSVIQPAGNYPSFGRFFPWGLEENQDDPSRRMMPQRPGGGFRYLRTQPRVIRRNQMVRYPTQENRPLSLGLGRGMPSQTPSSAGFDRIVVPSVGIVTVSGQDQGMPDGQGTASMADRVDVTLIQPSGQMFSATAGNQQDSTGQQAQAQAQAQPPSDASSLLGPLVQQIASGVMNNLQSPGQDASPAVQAIQAVASTLGGLGGPRPGNQSQPQQATIQSNLAQTQMTTPSPGTQLQDSGAQQMQLDNPLQLNPQVQMAAPSVNTDIQATDYSATAPTSTSNMVPPPSRGPSGLGRGSGLSHRSRYGRSGSRLSTSPHRPRQQRRSSGPSTTSENSGNQTRPQRSPGSSSQPDLMSLLGSMLSDLGSSQGAGSSGAGGSGSGGGGGGGGLPQMMESMVSSPAFTRMTGNPEFQRMVGGVLGDETQPQDMGSMINRISSQMMPVMTQLFGGGSQSAEASSQPPRVNDEVLEGELSPDEATRWRQILEADTAAQESCIPSSEPFSEVYTTGETLGKSNGLLGLVEGRDDGNTSGGDDAMSI